MNQEIQLKLQAYLDGELPPSEAKAMADLVTQDAEAGALCAELNHTRAALANHEAEIRLPETREFHWSKIQRELQRVEHPTPTAPVGAWLAGLRRWLVPAGSVALVALAVMLLQPQLATPEAGSHAAETEFTDGGGFTYRDYQNGVTLVWLSYPAENEFAQLD